MLHQGSTVVFAGPQFNTTAPEEQATEQVWKALTHTVHTWHRWQRIEKITAELIFAHRRTALATWKQYMVPVSGV